MRQKRFQYRTPEGVAWTNWFNYNGPEVSIQNKGYKGNHLKNEYRTV